MDQNTAYASHSRAGETGSREEPESHDDGLDDVVMDQNTAYISHSGQLLSVGGTGSEEPKYYEVLPIRMNGVKEMAETGSKEEPKYYEVLPIAEKMARTGSKQRRPQVLPMTCNK